MAFTGVKTITIDYTKVVNSNQTDFPICISETLSYLKTTGNGGNVTNANGYDINFFSDLALTTLLKWETERYIATTGEVIYWVKIPTLSYTANTVIYMAYGNAAITTDQSDAVNVWDSNYKGVWHFPDGTTLTADDSTTNAINGTLGTYGPIAGAGFFGGGAQCDNGYSPNINLGTPSALNINGAINISCWVKFDSVSKLQNIICKGGEDYRLRLNNTDIAVGSYDGNDHQTTYSSSVTTGVWYYLSGGYDGADWVLHLNGAEVSRTTDSTGAISGSNTTRIASGASGADRFFEGCIDELRVSATFRGANWVSTEHNNQNSPSTFYTIGSVVSISNSGFFRLM